MRYRRRFLDLDWHRRGQIGTDDDRLAGGERRNEQGSITVKVPTSTLDSMTILVVGQTVHDHGAELAENVGRNVSRPLGGEHTGQAVLPALLGNEPECLKAHAGVVVPDSATKELVS